MHQLLVVKLGDDQQSHITCGPRLCTRQFSSAGCACVGHETTYLTYILNTNVVKALQPVTYAKLEAMGL